VLGAQLRGLHVVEPAKFPMVVPLMFDQAEYERRCSAAFEKLAPPPDHVVRQGVAVDVIAEEAARWEADLVVVGSHGKGWAHRMLIGSSTERLLNLLPASLLVVPIPQPARRRPVQAGKARKGRAGGPKGKVVV
jgi:nucleotide-binding universal stress UspA family protein